MWKGRFRWRSSDNTPCDRRRGRLWSALHRLFDPHRVHLDLKSHRDSCLKYQTLEEFLGSAANEQEFSVAGASSSADGNGSTEMVSDGTYTKAVELQMKQHTEQKILPVNPARLMRILSIHHLECDNYVKSDKKVNPDDDDVSYEASSGPIHRNVRDDTVEENGCKHNPFAELSLLLLERKELFQEKLKEAKFAMSNNQDASFMDPEGDFSKNDAKKFLDALDVFHGNREKFLKILQDPNYLSVDHILDRGGLGVSPVPSMSMSCPGSGSSHYGSDASSNREKDAGSFANPDGKMQPGNFSSTSEANKTMEHDKKFLKVKQGDLLNAESSDPNETRNSKALHHLKDVSKRITLDGILDKIPVDQKKGSPRERSCLKGTFGFKRSASMGDSHFRRSRSLSDSIDKYSGLLGPHLIGSFHSHASNRSQPIPVDDSLQARQNTSKSLGRIYSLPEYESYPVKFTPSDDSHQSKPPRDTSQELDLDSSLMSCTSNYQGHLENPEIRPDDVARSEDSTGIVPKNSHRDIVTDMVHKTVNVNSSKISDELGIIAKDEDRNIMSCGQNIGYGFDNSSGFEVKNQSPPEIFLDEDLAYNARLFNGQEVVEKRDPLEVTTATHDHDIDTGGIKIFNRGAIMELDVDTIRFGVHEKDLTNFNYVMDILKMSEFSNSELLGNWYSPELPLDPSIFKELEGIGPEKEICSCVVDLNLHNLLLFDLMNEVLVEMYETNFVSHMPSRFPSLANCTYGLVFLKEVWANINRHLSSQPALDPEIDDIIKLDLNRNVGWMDWIFQVDGIGMDLEEMILGQVLNETIQESLNFTSS